MADSKLDLCDGDVVRLTSLRNNFALNKNNMNQKVGLLSVNFKAPKDKVFVAVMLGVEPKDGSAPMDLDSAMNKMGWYRRAE